MNLNLDERLDAIYQVLVERADGEEDPEAQKYNEYLIESIDMIKKEIDCKWEVIPPKQV